MEADHTEHAPQAEPAPKPPDLWQVMQRQVDRAFAEFLGSDDEALLWGEAASDPGSPSPPE